MLKINYQHSSASLDARLETKLIRLAQKGDKESTDKLILSHMAFLRSMCRKYGFGHYADFLGDAVIGMIDAINRKDTSKSCRLISFAYINVKCHILRSDYNDELIALSYHNRKNLWEIEKAEVKLHSENKQVTIESLSKLTNLSVKTISELQAVQESVESLDKSVYDNDKQTYLDFVQDELGDTAYEHINIRVDLDYFLSHLTHRERFIVERRYGIPVEMTNLQIGKRLDLSCNRVSSIFVKAMRKLRNLATALQGDPDEIKLVVENPQAVMSR